MENFASNLTSQAHEISRNLSKLIHDTKSADAKLQTATNSFMSLSDTQFIENVSSIYYFYLFIFSCFEFKIIYSKLF